MAAPGTCFSIVRIKGSHMSTATASTVCFCSGVRLAHNWSDASLVRSCTTSSTRDWSKSVSSVT